ncbi:MAG: hypothetical protein U1D31_00610 [Patescibacteria group bacterium]|nr:hypothetical protein [Desulfobacterales bacterium]MDZ4240623.1 hypothetical protein [Patescibacteria group bacterium]
MKERILTAKEKRGLKAFVDRLDAAHTGFELACKYAGIAEKDLWAALYKIDPKAGGFDHPPKGAWVVRIKEEK